MIRVKCPICEKLMQGASPKEWPELPFCSRRCRTIDLGRWLGEVYTFPPEEQPDDPALHGDETSLP